MSLRISMVVIRKYMPLILRCAGRTRTLGEAVLNVFELDESKLLSGDLNIKDFGNEIKMA